MTASRMLTQEQIDAGQHETRAAVERGRKALGRLRDTRTRAGIKPEKIQNYFSRMSPRARAWINSMVSRGFAEITRQKPAGTKAAVSKPRSMV